MAQTNKLFTVPQLADLLGVSRVTIWRKVRSGEIPAQNVGGMNLISQEEISHVLSKNITQAEKDAIDEAVRKGIADFSEVFKELARE